MRGSGHRNAPSTAASGVPIARPSRESVGWDGIQRETLRSENPVRASSSGVSPGERDPQNRAHNPKVEFSSRSLRSCCLLPGGKTPVFIDGDSTGAKLVSVGSLVALDPFGGSAVDQRRAPNPAVGHQPRLRACGARESHSVLGSASDYPWLATSTEVVYGREHS